MTEAILEIENYKFSTKTCCVRKVKMCELLLDTLESNFSFVTKRTSETSWKLSENSMPSVCR